MRKKKISEANAVYIKEKFAENPTTVTKKKLAAELRVGISSVESVLFGTYEFAKRFKQLTEEDKEFILSNPDNATYDDLAALFGISQAQVSKLMAGKVTVKKFHDPNIFTWVNNPAFF